MHYYSEKCFGLQKWKSSSDKLGHEFWQHFLYCFSSTNYTTRNIQFLVRYNFICFFIPMTPTIDTPNVHQCFSKTNIVILFSNNFTYLMLTNKFIFMEISSEIRFYRYLIISIIFSLKCTWINSHIANYSEIHILWMVETRHFE